MHWGAGIIIVCLVILYYRYQAKHTSVSNTNEKFAAEKKRIEQSTKPILWIYVPYEYNARNWEKNKFRGAVDLSQPYLYLTSQTILMKCNDSFTICFVDDDSFSELLPNWKINLSEITSCAIHMVRTLAMAQLVYVYGGFVCPISFVCMKNLIGLWNHGIRDNTAFVCEGIDYSDRGIPVSPALEFFGAEKENNAIHSLCEFLQRIISTNPTEDPIISGTIPKWLSKWPSTIRIISARDIGIMRATKNAHIELSELLGTQYLDVNPHTYGIVIHRREILSRTAYQWFVGMSPKEVLLSNTIIGKYILITLGDLNAVLSPIELVPDWNGFWRTPLLGNI